MPDQSVHSSQARSSSIASYSLQFVVLTVCALVLIAAAMGLFIYGVLGKFVRGSLRGLFLGSTAGIWLLCAALLWRHHLIRARALNLPSSPRLFVVFHAFALAFVVIMSFVVSSQAAEFQKATDVVRLVYDAVLVLFSLAYISFHFGLRRPVERSVYAGLAMAAVSVWMSFLV